MTTTGIESWAVDLATVGAVYPLQGLEWLMLIVGLVTWIGWHVWCMRWENETHEAEISEYGDVASLRKSLDDND